MATSPLDGNWTYRSFLNQPAPVGDDPDKALALIFGEGALNIKVSGEKAFRAVLDFGGGAAMDLFGTIVSGTAIAPDVLIITGTGREGTSTAKWVYQYQGYVVPNWPQGVNQVPAIVGTVVRTIPHGSGPAGVVASFVIVKQP